MPSSGASAVWLNAVRSALDQLFDSMEIGPPDEQAFSGYLKELPKAVQRCLETRHCTVIAARLPARQSNSHHAFLHCAHLVANHNP